MITDLDLKKITGTMRIMQPKGRRDTAPSNTVIMRRQWAADVLALEMAVTAINPHNDKEQFLADCGFAATDSANGLIARGGGISREGGS